MSVGASKRRWGGVYELLDMLEAVPGGMAFAVRDSALVTLAGELSAAFVQQLLDADEKLRALAQRLRDTDVVDLVVGLGGSNCDRLARCR